MFIKIFKTFNTICPTLGAHSKGFTIVGMLVASAIGLIVVAGLSQMFANMSSQIKQLEERGGRIFFNESIANYLRAGCRATLRGNAGAIKAGNRVEFTQIKGSDGRTVLDLHAEKERLKSEYGIRGHTYFQLTCKEPPGSPPYNCNYVSNCHIPTGCEYNWSLSLISQSMVNGLLMYNRTAHFNLRVALNPSSAHPYGLACRITSVSTSNNPISSGDCIKLNKADDLALVGCGTTTNINEKTTTAYGFDAGKLGAGKFNTFIGYQAGSQTTGEQNTFLGYQAGTSNTADSNTFIGYQAGRDNTTGEGNTFVGHDAGRSATDGKQNTFIGYQAGRDNITRGEDNTFIGYQAGASNTHAKQNTFIGYQAGTSNSKAGSHPDNNTFIGFKAGTSNTAGARNIFIGSEAGQANTTGRENTFIGAGQNNTTGSINTFIGFQAGKANTTGNQNTFLGRQAGASNTHAKQNTFIGIRSGYKNTTGEQNTFIGFQAGQANITGNYNTFLGYKAGRAATESKNTFIGFQAGQANTTGESNIFIGHQAKGGSNTGSNQLNIGNLILGKTPTAAPPAGNFPASDGVYIHGALTTNNKLEVKAGGLTVTGGLTVDGSPIPGPSSRTVKKNIKPFNSFQKALEDILKTPLFTYEYKKDHPEKSRMGIIAEDLPERLKIKSKPPAPDWPTIYGTLWAGLKALYKELSDLKTSFLNFKKSAEQSLKSLRGDLSSKFKSIALTLKSVKNSGLQLSQKLSRLTKNFKRMDSSLAKTNQNLDTAKKELAKEIFRLKAEFSSGLIKLETANKQLKESANSLSAENKKLALQLSETTARLDQISREMKTNKEELKRLKALKLAPLNQK